MLLIGNIELLIWLLNFNLINSKLTFFSSFYSLLFFTITRQVCGVLLIHVFRLFEYMFCLNKIMLLTNKQKGKQINYIE